MQLRNKQPDLEISERLDVSGLLPEAREIASAIAQVCLEELGDSLVTLLFHGSAVKGGVILGSSDLDFVLIVAPELLTEGDELPLARAASLHRRLATIDPDPFRYLQGYVGTRDRPPAAGFIPDAYAVVYGSADVPLATSAQLLDAAAHALSTLDRAGQRDRLSSALVKHGTGRLDREVRMLCTDVWPTVAHISCLAEHDGIAAWQRTKFENVALLERDPIMAGPVRAWHAAITQHYAAGETVDSGLAAISAGSDLLDAAAEWYALHRTLHSEHGHA
jgi:predicted nucleotidyltransferase